MKTVNTNILSGADTITISGPAIIGDQLVVGSFQTTFGDTAAAGTIQIQASNDIPPAGNIPNNFVPTHWSNIPNASSTVTAGIAPLILIPQMAFRWIRVQFVQTTPGTSTVSVNMFAFGV